MFYVLMFISLSLAGAAVIAILRLPGLIGTPIGILVVATISLACSVLAIGFKLDAIAKILANKQK